MTKEGEPLGPPSFIITSYLLLLTSYLIQEVHHLL